MSPQRHGFAFEGGAATSGAPDEGGNEGSSGVIKRQSGLIAWSCDEWRTIRVGGFVIRVNLKLEDSSLGFAFELRRVAHHSKARRVSAAIGHKEGSHNRRSSAGVLPV